MCWVTHRASLAVQAHEAQQIALPQEADLARFLGLGRGFILASGNYSGNSQWAPGLDNSQNQRSAVTATNGKLHPASTHDEHSPRSLPFGEQNRSRGIGGGECFLLQGIGYDWRKIAKGFVCWRRFLGVIYDMCGHIVPPLTGTLASPSATLPRPGKAFSQCRVN